MGLRARRAAAGVACALTLGLAACTSSSGPIRATPSRVAAPTPSAHPSTPIAKAASPTSSTTPPGATTTVSSRPSGDYEITHVPERWVYPANARISNLVDGFRGATYDIAGYSTAELLGFYRAKLVAPAFSAVADVTGGDVTTLIYDDAVYRTTITSLADGVHVEHRIR